MSLVLLSHPLCISWQPVLPSSLSSLTPSSSPSSHPSCWLPCCCCLCCSVDGGALQKLAFPVWTRPTDAHGGSFPLMTRQKLQYNYLIPIRSNPHALKKEFISRGGELAAPKQFFFGVILYCHYGNQTLLCNLALYRLPPSFIKCNTEKSFSLLAGPQLTTSSHQDLCKQTPSAPLPDLCRTLNL